MPAASAGKAPLPAAGIAPEEARAESANLIFETSGPSGRWIVLAADLATGLPTAALAAEEA